MHRLLLAIVAVICLARPARAEDGHFGLEFNFLGGVRSYDQSRFSRTDGDTSPSLVSAFEGEPFDGVTVVGAGVESHLVVNGVRFAIGWARPYVQYDGPIVSRDAETAVASTVQVRRMEGTEWQFGLGYELDLGRGSVFADLVGTADKLDTDLAIGDEQGTYRTRGFGFSTRLGGRIAFHEMFYLHAAGELGLTGHRDFGVVAGIGMGKP
jgi:hypothetical protein